VRRTAVHDAERNSALKESRDRKNEEGYVDRETVSTRDEARRGRR